MAHRELEWSIRFYSPRKLIWLWNRSGIPVCLARGGLYWDTYCSRCKVAGHARCISDICSPCREETHGGP